MFISNSIGLSRSCDHQHPANKTDEAKSKALIEDRTRTFREQRFQSSKLLFAAVLRIAANCCFHGSSLLTAVTETQV